MKISPEHAAAVNGFADKAEAIRKQVAQLTADIHQHIANIDREKGDAMDLFYELGDRSRQAAYWLGRINDERTIL
jgi:hypothetical protein